MTRWHGLLKQNNSHTAQTNEKKKHNNDASKFENNEEEWLCIHKMARGKSDKMHNCYGLTERMFVIVLQLLHNCLQFTIERDAFSSIHEKKIWLMNHFEWKWEKKVSISLDLQSFRYWIRSLQRLHSGWFFFF